MPIVAHSRNSNVDFGTIPKTKSNTKFAKRNNATNMTANPTATTIDKSVIRRINSLLDEGDDDAKVVIDVHLFPADTTPTEEDVRRFWERHCSDLNFVSVQALLADLLLQKRSVSAVC